MKISVVIPTRSRAEYLRSCVASALHARDLARCEVEIVVSDNASDDDTPELAASLTSEGVRCVRTPGRYSMRANFEFALDATSGTHIVVIGDDDAVVPHGLRHLGSLIGDTGAEVVNWTVHDYVWPDPARGTEGHLDVRPLKLSGRLRRQPAAGVLDRVLAGRFRSYHSGGVIYHGCVARTLIDRARASSHETYFWGESPDVFASMRNLQKAHTDILRVAAPLTLGGTSPRSNGASWKRYSAGETEAMEPECVRFVEESSGDEHNGLLPSDTASLALATLDALLLAFRLEGEVPAIDAQAWRRKVERELRGLPPQTIEINRGYLERLLAVARGTDEPTPPIAAPPSTAPAQTAPAAPPKPRKGNLFRAAIRGGPDMATVESAAIALDRISGIGRGAAATSFPIGSALRTIAVARRARAAEKAGT